MFPVFLRNFLFCCPLHIKFAGTVDLNRITVTDHIMFYTKCFQTISIHLKNLFWLCNFSIVDFKWQFRRDHSQRTHYSLQTFRSNQSKRFLSVRISHCKKKSRKSADMISMVMCKTNYTGFLRRVASGRYIAVVEERQLEQFAKRGYDVLDKIRALDPSVNLSISIGIGRGAKTLREAQDMAVQALDMAQGRGGDQAAEMTPDGFTFYGGVSHGVEKRSKVRSRIVADQLVKRIKEADHVVIMGHRMSDLDAIGSAEGVLRICKICDVPAVIAVRRDATLAGSLINALIAAGQEDDFIDPKGALPIISQRTLCIVVDTYQLGLVESREILEKCGKVAVIDHHRKGVGFIEKADLVCHEPYASSASELVTEFLQYVGDRDDKPNRIEAEGLLSGIMLDTRDFTLHTGVRTFEAAAALRRYGAETEHVRQLFDVSMVEYTTKAMLVSEAQMYRGCAITVSGEVAPEARVAIAQAANDLLTIQNVEASFVAVQVGGGVNISARSLGAVNVQVIMESLGGGGHQTMAAAQLKHITPEAARSRIQTAIDQYREAQKKSGLESGSEQKKKDKQ